MIVILVYTCSQVYCMIIQYVQCVSSGRGFSVWVGVILTFYLFILFVLMVDVVKRYCFLT